MVRIVFYPSPIVSLNIRVSPTLPSLRYWLHWLQSEPKQKHQYKHTRIPKTEFESTSIFAFLPIITLSLSLFSHLLQIINGKYVEGFYIYARQLDSTNDMTYKMLTVLNGGGASTCTITGLMKYQSYEFFIVPFYKSVEGKPSNSRVARTLEDGKFACCLFFVFSVSVCCFADFDCFFVLQIWLVESERWVHSTWTAVHWMKDEKRRTKTNQILLIHRKLVSGLANAILTRFNVVVVTI